MINSTLNLDKQIEEVVKDLPNNNYLLGKSSLQPFAPMNSGSRKLMHNVHADQFVVMDNAEPPTISTGTENEYGRFSTSFREAEANFEVLAKVQKYSFNPTHYYLILKNLDTGEYDMKERYVANHNTESFGYMNNNKYMDSLKPGSVIHKGDVYRKSIGFDDYNNKMNGINLTTMYCSCEKNMEDSIIISDWAAEAGSVTLTHTIPISLNDNDILLNRYGDDDNYKAFPDIGENIKENMFCSVRRFENDNVLYTLSQSRLKDIFISDKNAIVDGTVADINVYCNNPELLSESVYNQQLYFYYTEHMRFCKEICDIVAPLAMNGKLTYELKELYADCRDIIAGKKYFKDKVFSNIYIEVLILEKKRIEVGDKMTDRYGGKGIVSHILPVQLMPVLDNGEVVHVIKNQSTCYNRENIGQLNEQSLTFMGNRVLDYIKLGVLTITEQAKLIYDFMYSVSPALANYEFSGVDFYDEQQAEVCVNNYLSEGCIKFALPSFTSNITLDTLADIYAKFPWIKPYKVYVPMEGSDGEIRYVETRRPVVVGKIFNMRLKQFAEEKFSVTSLSATNLKNLNTKSRASKLYETKYTKTPVMFGNMENGTLAHLSMQYVIMNLMLYSSSPQARRLFEHLLTGDPYNIDIKLDEYSKNRNAEIINVRLKTMGLRLKFIKVPKKKKFLFKNTMFKMVPLKGYQYKTNIRDIIGHEDEFEMQYRLAKQSDAKKICKNVMFKEVDKNESKS